MAVDAAVREGAFPNRTAALHAAVRMLVRELRDRKIEDAYRRGYGSHPQEAWIGRFGLDTFGAAVAAEEADGPPL